MKPANLGCMRPMAIAGLLFAIGVIGCNIQWIPDHTALDPSPPQVVVAPQFRFLVIEETLDRPSLPPDQVAIFTSLKLRDYLDSHCVKLADGSKGYRFVDQNEIDTLPLELKKAGLSFTHGAVPWLFCTDGSKGLSCPLPANDDELISKIKPYAEGR